MKARPDHKVKTRMLFVGIGFFLLMTAISAKAVYLQVFCGGWLSQKAADQYEQSLVTLGKRGTIYDTNQQAMAVTIGATSVAAYPARIKDTAHTAKALASALKLKRRSLQRCLASSKSFVWVKRQVTPKEAEAVAQLKLDGIDFIPEHSRYYPQKTMAAQLIGFAGIDGHGLEGLEFYYDKELKGPVQHSTVLKDAFGRGFNYSKKSPPRLAGDNLVLTVDVTIQYITEKALEEAVKMSTARSGMAVVMNPKSGAVLALAHYPFFNPNAFTAYHREEWRNRAVTDPFEPGSTMKIFSMAAALESGKCTPNTIFFCENGTYMVGRHTIHDTSPRGWLSLQQIVKYSSNIGAVKVSELIGPQALFGTLGGFGFGQRTQIDCPGETAGSLAPFKHWSQMDASAIAFGQGLSASAIQMITAASSIANDGILMQPFVVRAITDQNGRVLKTFQPRVLRRVVAPETARTLRRIMTTVITDGGTGTEAALEGYTACGKTGTAQKIDQQGTYAEGKYIASFIGFAPAEQPEVAILVVVDEPVNDHYGGVVAAPAFRKIAQETLNYLNVPPSIKRDRLTASQMRGAAG
jgi:cell division protein FtsI (penicillin-binding protein 3)